jgi:hypothetical protein
MCGVQSLAMVGPYQRFGQFAAGPGSALHQMDIQARFAASQAANLSQYRHRPTRNRKRRSAQTKPFRFEEKQTSSRNHSRPFDGPGAGRDNQLASLDCVRLLGHRQVMLRCRRSTACTGLFNIFVLGVVLRAHGADGTRRVGSEPHPELLITLPSANHRPRDRRTE